MNVINFPSGASPESAGGGNRRRSDWASPPVNPSPTPDGDPAALWWPLLDAHTLQQHKVRGRAECGTRRVAACRSTVTAHPVLEVFSDAWMTATASWCVDCTQLTRAEMNRWAWARFGIWLP